MVSERRNLWLSAPARPRVARRTPSSDPTVTEQRRPWRLPRIVAIGRSFATAGLIGGLIAFGLAQVPSLIPRPWLNQGIFTGVTVALGYGIGVLIGWFARRAGIHPRWSERTRRNGRYALAVGGFIVVAAAMVLSAWWQSRARELLDMPDISPAFVAIVPVAAAVAALIVLAAKGARAGGRLLVRGMGRLVPMPIVRTVTAMAAIALVVLVFNGTVMNLFTATLDRYAAWLDRAARVGVPRPTLPERSGSPASDVPWASIGRQGRLFVSGGPTVAELSAFAAERGERSGDVQVPIRVYASVEEVDGAEDMAEAAALVVDELDRTSAWDREVLVVSTPTSTGKVSPPAVDAIELMYGGDTAVAAMQYSYVPSWISFLADRENAPEAGKALFEAVYEAWSARPPNARPMLLVHGESLGSHGGNGAFSSLQDMLARTDGALWVATPHRTETRRDLVESRAEGSPERTPVYDGGRQVRWGNGGESDLWELGPDWEHPRVVYLQHASDAVVWWSADLLLHEPDWLSEPNGPDVLPGLRWLPIVTYWQVTMDLSVAEEPAMGYGHNYVLEYADAWAAIAAPRGWTDADTDALRDLLGTLYADQR